MRQRGAARRSGRVGPRGEGADLVPDCQPGCVRGAGYHCFWKGGGALQSHEDIAFAVTLDQGVDVGSAHQMYC